MTHPFSDQWTFDHFQAWLDSHVFEDEHATVREQIFTLLADHPDLVAAHSWPEMRRMAESTLPR